MKKFVHSYLNKHYELKNHNGKDIVVVKNKSLEEYFLYVELSIIFLITEEEEAKEFINSWAIKVNNNINLYDYLNPPKSTISIDGNEIFEYIESPITNKRSKILQLSQEKLIDTINIDILIQPLHI